MNQSWFVEAKQQKIGLIFLGLLMFLSLLVMISWWTGHYQMTTLVASFPSMKFNTALCFLLLSASLCFAAFCKHPYWSRRTLPLRLSGFWGMSVAGTVIVAVIAMLSILSMFYPVLGAINEFFVRDPLSVVAPGRMSQSTATEFLFCAMLNLLLIFPQATRAWVVDVLYLLALCLVMIALATYFVSPEALFEVSAFSSMAIHTAFGFALFLAGFGFLYSRNEGALGLFMASSIIGRMLRLHILQVISIPLLVATAIQYMYARGWFGGEFAAVLFLVSVLAILLVTLCATAQKEQDYQHRLEVERTSKFEMQVRLTSMLNLSGDGLILFRKDTSVVYANQAAAKLFGWSVEEMLQKRLVEFLPSRVKREHHQWMSGFLQQTQKNILRFEPGRVQGVHKSGQEIPLLLDIVKQQFGDDLYIAAVVRDATAITEKFEALADEARLDVLTESRNRRSFDEYLARFDSKSRRDQETVAVIMLDLDHFKQVNDVYGHDAGDQVLKHFADTVRRCLRANDLFFRYGGEEFVIISTITSAEVLQGYAERVRAEVERECTNYKGKFICVTCSIGYSSLRPSERSLEACVKRADVALYHAKDHGRNRVELL
ncbi:MAG: sensor domain-containing diguanylate cyclase [Hahellaceae bacterium]|nr:sensor domain-containing diguanylate cyclase [Hahellaceae bacterium]MCP5170068.1 sensor domain-containing diguanylate cyclase [Hahellaceae bacterium]